MVKNKHIISELKTFFHKNDFNKAINCILSTIRHLNLRSSCIVIMNMLTSNVCCSVCPPTPNASKEFNKNTAIFSKNSAVFLKKTAEFLGPKGPKVHRVPKSPRFFSNPPRHFRLAKR